MAGLQTQMSVMCMLGEESGNSPLSGVVICMASIVQSHLGTGGTGLERDAEK